MRSATNTVREHFLVVITVVVLTLVMTYPTIVNVFKTDVFWHPAGASHDVYIKYWDIWYGKQILQGKVDPFYTELLFYPNGVTLVFHPLFLLHSAVVSALHSFMPVSNAFSLVYLLITCSCALSTYVYVFWLFKEKWLALFGAAMFGFCPNVAGNPNWPEIAWIATIPLAVYCFHRGTVERRNTLIILAGLFTGLTSTVTLYHFASLLITLGCFAIALAVSRWNDRSYWLRISLLIVTVALASAWRLQPVLLDADGMNAALSYYSQESGRTNITSFFVNERNPIAGPLANAVFQSSEIASVSAVSYLGFLPLTLCGFGLLTASTRRIMLPWFALCLGFLVLALGPTLRFHNFTFDNILLPKHYLDQLLPQVFGAFTRPDHFVAGVRLPLTVLACYGLVALRQRFVFFSRPVALIGLTLFVALEYHIPVNSDQVFPLGNRYLTEAGFAFLDWLRQEERDDIGLINVPFGRSNSKFYLFYQSLTGYPQTEGAISRTPDSAYNYIRSNFLLNEWLQNQAISCAEDKSDKYLAALDELAADGFSHVVYHRGFYFANDIVDSFSLALPSYEDEFVQIYRLSDLRDSCSEILASEHPLTYAYAELLDGPSIMRERRGTVVLRAPNKKTAEHLLRYLVRVSQIQNRIIVLASNEADETVAYSSDPLYVDVDAVVEHLAAVWLVNDPKPTDPAHHGGNKQWLQRHYRLCQRYAGDASATFELYLRTEIPCGALGVRGEIMVDYGERLSLISASSERHEDALRFYFAWANESKRDFGFSIQLYDSQGEKAAQYDSRVRREPLSVHDVDISSTPDGSYKVKLIVYERDTGASIDGTVMETGQHFERELLLATVDL